MTKLCLPRNVGHLVFIVLMCTRCEMAEWKAANEQVAAAAKEPRIAAVLGGCQWYGCGAGEG